MSKADLRALEKRLGHAFSDGSLLTMALTHPSFGSDHHAPDYQRLEFLGDAVLELSCSRLLYDECPEMTEGQLTVLRARMVCEESLAALARALELGACVRLSVGEEKSGGADKPSILCDVFESVLGAVYLDGGYEAAFALVRRLLEPLLPKAQSAVFDAKTTLQEKLQKRGDAPEYELIGQSGPTHQPVFRVRVLCGGVALGEGEGRSKRAAQQEAAAAALKMLASKDG